MSATTREELATAQESGRTVTIATRPPGGVTQLLSNVTVVAVTVHDVSVRGADGEVRTVNLDTLVDVDAERHQRDRRRRLGWLFDLFGLTR